MFFDRCLWHLIFQYCNQIRAPGSIYFNTCVNNSWFAVCDINVETVSTEFQMEMIVLERDTDLRTTFEMSDFLNFINSVYLPISFQCLVTMHVIWQASLEARISVNGSFQTWKWLRVNVKLDLLIEDRKAASKFLLLIYVQILRTWLQRNSDKLLVDILPSFKIKL